MTTETVLSDRDKTKIAQAVHYQHLGVVEAINRTEQAVLQSAEVQRLRGIAKGGAFGAKAMSQLKMPEPVGWVNHNVLTGAERTTRLPIQSLQPGVYRHTKLYNEEQMEAYANAMVREALERAAGIIRANAEACDSGTRIMLRANAEAVLALIPSTPARSESEQ